MNFPLRFLAAFAVLALLMLGPLLAVSWLIWLDTPPEGRQLLDQIVGTRLPLAMMVLLFALFLGGALLHALLRQYVAAPLAMAEQMRLMLGANRAFRLPVTGTPEYQALARAANDLADQRDALLADVEAQVLAARAAVEQERNRLAALISDLPQPVLVCNLDGRILLYNNRARLQVRALAPGGQSGLVGLGRSIFAVFDRALIQHALESLHARLERAGSQPLAHFVTISQRGQFIRVQMAPVLGAGEREISGYVLTLENISRYLETENECDLLMRELAAKSRASLAALRGAVRQLHNESQASELQVIEQEIDRLTQQWVAVDQRYAEAMRTRWPLEEMRASDLMQAIAKRITNRSGSSVTLDEVPDELWVKVDSFSLTQAMSFLVNRLHEDYGVKRLRLRATLDEGRVALELLWTGTAISTEILMSWQLEAMSEGGESSPLTLRDVTDRHGGEFSAGRDSATQMSRLSIRIPLASGQDGGEAAALMQIESRPEFYDFDLFHRSEENHALDDRPLRSLTYTVFDTETTGLEPSKGDEIIQIGAVRIVNGRLLKHENFDQLVDPQRPLNPESIPIHGIREEMLRGQPTIETVLPAFHRFCEDTVLVAHNAAFDLRFLQLKEKATGVRFTQPVLDTLLLSAVVHPNQESHKLEAIAERLGLPIIGRHNALGDAIVTAEVFLRLITLLEAQGIQTLAQAREAAQKTRFAKVSY